MADKKWDVDEHGDARVVGVKMVFTLEYADGSRREFPHEVTADFSKGEEITSSWERKFDRRGDDYWDMGETTTTIKKTYPPRLSTRPEE